MRTVKWIQAALDGQRAVVDYILEEFGAKAAMEFQEKVEKAERLIAENPQIMPIERYARSSKFEYRSIIINKRSKMLYVEHDGDIIIVDFWDVRQEPTLNMV